MTVHVKNQCDGVFHTCSCFCPCLGQCSIGAHWGGWRCGDKEVSLALGGSSQEWVKKKKTLQPTLAPPSRGLRELDSGCDPGWL